MSSYAFHVDELYSMRDKKEQREYHNYSKMLDRVYKRIIMVEKKGMSDLIYETEPFIPGMPLYSKEYAINYIIHHLKLSGFKCYYMGESFIYINWGIRKKSNRKSEPEIQKEKEQKYYNIKRSVHVPEYKQYCNKSQSSQLSNVYPSNSNIHIKNPDEFIYSVQNNKPDFSINNIKKLRHTVNKMHSYK